MSNIPSLANRVRSMGGHREVVLAEALESMHKELVQLRADLIAATSADGIAEAIREISAGSYSQGIYFASVLVELTDPNDFGLRFLSLKCTYSSNIEEMKKVEVWVEDPVDGEARSLGTFQHTSTGVIYIPYNSPATAHDIRIYLVPVSSTVHYQLHTVSEYGETNASPNKTVGIYPIPTTDLGIEYAGVVTGLGVTDPNEGTGEGYFYDANGLYRAKIEVTFTKPSGDERFAGIEVMAKKPGPVWESLGRFGNSPTGDIVVSCPPTVENHTIYAVSYDKFGRRNSIVESTPPGTLTPSVTISVGDAAGKLDIAKALSTSLSPALVIAANVLGVATGGITEALIGQFAVSKLKLKNAPIIDAARIEDLAVGTGHIQLLAIGTALVQNAAIVNAKVGAAEIYGAIIANAGIDSAKISSLVVDKITGWAGSSIDFGAGITYTGTGTFNITAHLSVTNSISSGTSINANGGFRVDGVEVIDGVYRRFNGAGGVDTAGHVKGLELWANGSAVVNSVQQWIGNGIHITSGVVKIGGVQVVGSRQTGISDASVAHSFADLAAAEAGCNALGGKINSILAAMETHGLLAVA